MERRIGATLIIVEKKDSVHKLNEILTSHASIILGRQGIPVREKNLNIISLVLEGTTDEIGSLTGQIGKLEGVSVRSVMSKQ
ncbi:MAG: iron-only hydrogenase system regulator [Bacteroidales bacterium]|nr:iron-only hydrogenase system regulator [Bacteroidales bacterium]